MKSFSLLAQKLLRLLYDYNNDAFNVSGLTMSQRMMCENLTDKYDLGIIAQTCEELKYLKLIEIIPLKPPLYRITKKGEEFYKKF